jgi:ADP-heptose:LPS heptosyltransferase
MPFIGDPAELWEEFCEQRLGLSEHIPAGDWDDVQSFVKSLPRPVVLLHTIGNSRQDTKSLSPGFTVELYQQLLDRIDGSILMLDWDNRVPRFPSNRVRHLLDDWKRIDLPSLIGLIEAADLLIGIDSGPLHAARFTDTPSIGLFPHLAHYPPYIALPRVAQMNIVPREMISHATQEVRSEYNIVSADRDGLDASFVADQTRWMIESPKRKQTVRRTRSTSVEGQPRRLILKNSLCPGDILMLSAAVRDLHLSHPGKFETDLWTSCPAIWENNPYVTKLDPDDSGVEQIKCDYPLINQSNQRPYHMIHGFRLFLQERLGIPIEPHAFKGDIHLSALERSWMSQVEEILGLGARFWIIVSGGKRDFTAKWWDPDRAQQVINHFRGRIQFVQCGEGGHHHPRLEGVIDLVGKTDLRQMIRLMWHADGVICPVTMFMHLAAAVETKPGRPINRPCVVVAGGREPPHWEAYPHHQFLHTNGALPCCDNGGCWKSRVEPLGDNDEKDKSLCLRPVILSTGRKLPQCLDMITAADVIRAVEMYLRFDTPPEGEPMKSQSSAAPAPHEMAASFTHDAFTLRCPSCSNGLSEADLFCGSCGRTLTFDLAPRG